MGYNRLTIYTEGCATSIRRIQETYVVNMNLSVCVFVICTAVSVPFMRLYTTSKMRATQFGGAVDDAAQGWIFWEDEQSVPQEKSNVNMVQ